MRRMRLAAQCIDDPDISIRMRALDLAVGMVNAENLQLIVDRLLAQLLSASYQSATDEAANDRGFHNGVEPRADSDDEDAGSSLRKGEQDLDMPVALPEDYRINAIRSILNICSRDTYANVQDFEWYIEILQRLVKACPAVSIQDARTTSLNTNDIVQNDISHDLDVGHCVIGLERKLYYPSWYQIRTSGDEWDRDAAEKSQEYHNLPKSVHKDAAGRAIVSIDRNGVRDLETRHIYDYYGNLIGARDPYGRLIYMNSFDLLGR